MQNIIAKGQDFRIIPENFESATTFDLKEVGASTLDIEIKCYDNKILSDYKMGAKVEIFGSIPDGLVYFQTKVIDANGTRLTIELPENIKNIQRREYSRVKFMGDIEFECKKDMVLNVEDISAGGLKMITKEPLKVDSDYPIKITLINNLDIECTFTPIRVQDTIYKEKEAYVVSGSYKDISSIERIALVQYSFKVMMEIKSKNDE